MKRLVRLAQAVLILTTTATIAGLTYAQAPPCPEITVFEDGTPALSKSVNCNFSILEDRIEGNKTDILKLDVNNVIWVAKTGGDYTSLSAAMSSITTASASNPFLIRIAPGTYYLSNTQAVKDHVYIRGSGIDVTNLECINTTNCSTILSFGDVKTRVSDLTIYNRGAGKFGARVLGTGQNTCDITLENVRVRVSATGSGINEAIQADTCFYVTIKNSSVRIAGGGTNNYGVWLENNTYVRVSGLEITVSSGSENNYGLYLKDNINTRYESVNASANGGSARAAGLYVLSTNPNIDASYFSGTGATQYNYAAYNVNGFLTLNDSTLSTNTSDPNHRAAYHGSRTSGRTRLINSMITGPFICEGPATSLSECFRCGGVYERSLVAELDSFCEAP